MSSNWSYSPEMFNSGQNWQFFVLCDLKIWWMTLENNRSPPLCYLKLCASFRSHLWIQTGVTVRKHSIYVKICKFLSHVILKFDRWPWKTIGHLSYATSNFVKHSEVKKVWQTDRQTDRWTDWRMDRQTDRQTDGQMDGWTVRWTDRTIQWHS